MRTNDEHDEGEDKEFAAMVGNLEATTGISAVMIEDRVEKHLATFYDQICDDLYATAVENSVRPVHAQLFQYTIRVLAQWYGHRFFNRPADSNEWVEDGSH